MNNKELLKIYSEVSRLLNSDNFDAVDHIIISNYDKHPLDNPEQKQSYLEFVVGLLRLTFQWRSKIDCWEDVAQLTYERLNNPEIMRDLI